MPRPTWLRWLLLVLACTIGLQLYFVLRIAAMAVIDPQSTSFQRSEAWAQLTARSGLAWGQSWLPYQHISPHLKRAVIASEDDGFAHHDGVDWNAIEKAWSRNAQAEAKAAAQNAKRSSASASKTKPNATVTRPPKIVGGSTITQQLAKNLLLSPERTLLRKGQELALTFLLEQCLSKQRILEIYLNSVEWGDGIFGAEAAAQHYFQKSARLLSPSEAARLAVMLPAPKRFEKNPRSDYLTGRTRTILARMGAANIP